MSGRGVMGECGDTRGAVVLVGELRGRRVGGQCVRGEKGKVMGYWRGMSGLSVFGSFRV